MANCAIVGINWGDEGKGRMVDYLTGQYDVVVRYQGGGNAGHTCLRASKIRTAAGRCSFGTVLLWNVRQGKRCL